MGPKNRKSQPTENSIFKLTTKPNEGMISVKVKVAGATVKAVPISLTPGKAIIIANLVSLNEQSLFYCK